MTTESVQPLCSLWLTIAWKTTTEQLCWRSSRKWFSFDSPWFVIANHHVNDGQQFAHTGHKGNFFKFVPGDEPLIESFDNWIAANGSQGGHVELGPHLRSAGEDVTSATLFTTVTIEWGDAG